MWVLSKGLTFTHITNAPTPGVGIMFFLTLASYEAPIAIIALLASRI